MRNPADRGTSAPPLKRKDNKTRPNDPIVAYTPPGKTKAPARRPSLDGTDRGSPNRALTRPEDKLINPGSASTRGPKVKPKRDDIRRALDIADSERPGGGKVKRADLDRPLQTTARPGASGADVFANTPARPLRKPGKDDRYGPWGNGAGGYGDPPGGAYDDDHWDGDWDDDDWDDGHRRRRWRDRDHHHHHHHHHHWDNWYWWDRGYNDYCYGSSGWHGFSFGFSFYSGHSTRWWLSYRTGLNDCFRHPWRRYHMYYDTCYVTYHRPWRSWFNYYYEPYWSYCDSWSWPRRTYTRVHDVYRYHDVYNYEPATNWYVSYNQTQPAESALPTMDHAWSLLRDDYVYDAADAFAQLVYALPWEGEARLGYAISVGLQWRDDAALEAMRRVLRDDPGALRSAPMDAQMRNQVYRLLEYWDGLARQDWEDEDPLFMSAALRFMLGDTAAAYFAVDSAIRAGDERYSAENLRIMIEEVLHRDY
jgi:hypothetical protein